MTRAERKAEAKRKRQYQIVEWLEAWQAWGKQNNLETLPTSWLRATAEKDIRRNPQNKSELIRAFQELRLIVKETVEEIKDE